MVLINSGKYGCIYQPGFPCRSGGVVSQRFVSKVQRANSNAEREAKIGSIIRHIRHYPQFFAPILSSCPIKITDKIKGCDVVRSFPDSSYVSNKIRFLGNHTLDDYLVGVLEKKPDQYLGTIIKTYQYLLHSLSLLQGVGLVHLDIKENNIMCDSICDFNPVVIDFGISFSIDESKKTGDGSWKKDVFYKVYEKYPPWCVEVVILAYIARNGFDGGPSSTHIEEMKKLVKSFVSSNPALQMSWITEKERGEYLDVVLSMIGSMSWDALWDIFFSSYASWDNYSLAVVYLTILDGIGVSVPFLDSFVGVLKGVVLSDPRKRTTPDLLIKDLVGGAGAGLLLKVSKKDITLFVREIRRLVSGKEYVDSRKQRHSEWSMSQLADDQRIMP
jgi:serine/threonine protein kinase